MLQPEGNQALGETERNQTLRRCPRDLQHFGDFVLGVTGNEVQPAGTRGLVQTRFLVVGCCHQAPTAPSAKNPSSARTRDRPPPRAGSPGRLATDNGCRQQSPKPSCRPPPPL